MRCCPWFPVQPQSAELPGTTEGKWRRRHSSQGLVTAVLLHKSQRHIKKPPCNSTWWREVKVQPRGSQVQTVRGTAIHQTACAASLGGYDNRGVSQPERVLCPFWPLSQVALKAPERVAAQPALPEAVSQARPEGVKGCRGRRVAVGHLPQGRPTQELDRPTLLFNTVLKGTLSEVLARSEISALTSTSTCPRSCVAVVRWFGAWYFGIGRHWDGLSRSYLSFLLLSVALVFVCFFSSLPNGAPGAENLRGTVPSRSTNAEGISYIPCRD